MESRLLLDVVVRKSASILKLLSGKDKTLLIRWDSLLVLDLGLDVVNSVRWLDIKSDGFTSQSFDENLKREGYITCESFASSNKTACSNVLFF